MYPHTREKNSCTRLLSTPRVMSERLSQVHAVLQLSRDGASWKLTIEDQLKQWICWMIRSQLIVFMHYMYCTPGSPVVDAAVIRLLQDRSSNGTWVNGTSGASRWNLISLHLVLHSLHFQQTSFLSTFVPSSSLRSILGPGVRLKAKEQMALKTCDQICFVPPGNGVEQLVYEARSITIVPKNAIWVLWIGVPAAVPFLRRKNQVLPANMLQRTACRPTEVLDPEPLRGSFLGSWWRRSCRRGVFMSFPHLK